MEGVHTALVLLPSVHDDWNQLDFPQAEIQLLGYSTSVMMLS